ncbi:hypothetical protein PSPO01_09068 [Paraphaeosphaeria sporulosa]
MTVSRPRRPPLRSAVAHAFVPSPRDRPPRDRRRDLHVMSGVDQIHPIQQFQEEATAGPPHNTISVELSAASELRREVYPKFSPAPKSSHMLRWVVVLVGLAASKRFTAQPAIPPPRAVSTTLEFQMTTSLPQVRYETHRSFASNDPPALRTAVASHAVRMFPPRRTSRPIASLLAIPPQLHSRMGPWRWDHFERTDTRGAFGRSHATLFSAPYIQIYLFTRCASSLGRPFKNPDGELIRATHSGEGNDARRIHPFRLLALFWDQRRRYSGCNGHSDESGNVMNLFARDSHDRYFHPSKEATDASGPQKMTIAPAGLRFGRRCRAIKRISPRELFTITEVHETWVIHNGMMGSRAIQDLEHLTGEPSLARSTSELLANYMLTASGQRHLPARDISHRSQALERTGRTKLSQVSSLAAVVIWRHISRPSLVHRVAEMLFELLLDAVRKGKKYDRSNATRDEQGALPTYAGRAIKDVMCTEPRIDLIRKAATMVPLMQRRSVVEADETASFIVLRPFRGQGATLDTLGQLAAECVHLRPTTSKSTTLFIPISNMHRGVDHMEMTESLCEGRLQEPGHRELAWHAHITREIHPRVLEWAWPPSLVPSSNDDPRLGHQHPFTSHETYRYVSSRDPPVPHCGQRRL